MGERIARRSSAVRVAPHLFSCRIRCTDCGALFSGGRWTWGQGVDARPGLCPACQRTRDDSPVARVSIPVAHARECRDVLARVETLAAAERSAHPLERILDVRAFGQKVEVTTTGLRLSIRIVDELGDRGGVRREVLGAEDGPSQ